MTICSATPSRLLATTVGLLMSQAALAATNTTLTFDGGVGVATNICSSTFDGQGSAVMCSNNTTIAQSYGDISGVLDVQYSAPRLTGASSLYWWNTTYNNLYGVVWAAGGDSNSQARITLLPLEAGSVVTLNSFDLGAYSNTTRATTVTVTEVGTGNILFSYSGNVGNSNISATSFSPSVTSSVGMQLTWQDSAYNVGIDNISLTVTPVPEASSVAMALAGLGVMSLAVWRRQQSNVRRPSATSRLS